MSILNFLFIFLFFIFLNLTLQAKTWQVGKDLPIQKIKEALRLAQNGDTILIHQGFYQEGNLIIDKSITLIGKNYPVLDGQRKYEILSIKADKVSIIGLKIQKSGFASLDDPGGIKVYDSQNVVIQDNILDDNFFGIYLQYSQNCIIKNNQITAYGTAEHQIGNGIHCWKSDTIQIIANQIKGHRDGIYFEFVSQSIIWRNISQKNVRYGLHFMFSNDDAYINNHFEGNGAGVAVMFTKRVKMFYNTFQENWGDSSYGLFLKEISDSYLLGNHFLKNTCGIVMEGTNRILVERNIFQSNGWGMKIQASCMENTIQESNFIGNTFDISTNGSLVLNTFQKNYWDRYEGYDLNKDKIGDVPYHPLSLFAVVAERQPAAMLLFRSFMVTLLDKSEKILPSITPDNFVDNSPLMQAIRYD